MSVREERKHPREIQFGRFVATVRDIGNEDAINELEETFNGFVKPVHNSLTTLAGWTAKE